MGIVYTPEDLSNVSLNEESDYQRKDIVHKSRLGIFLTG